MKQIVSFTFDTHTSLHFYLYEDFYRHNTLASSLTLTIPTNLLTLTRI